VNDPALMKVQRSRDHRGRTRKPAAVERHSSSRRADGATEFLPVDSGARTSLLPGARLALAVLTVAVVVVFLASQLAVPGGLGLGFVQSRLYPIEYREMIGSAAERYGVDPYLVAAVVKAESGYQADALSPAGAVGLMQLMPSTAQWIEGREDWAGGTVTALTDPESNIELGTYYLAFLLGLFDGDVRTTLAAYNAGQGTVAEWLATGSFAEGAFLESSDIPYPETRGFVERVERLRSIYLEAHPDAFGPLA